MASLNGAHEIVRVLESDFLYFSRHVAVAVAGRLSHRKARAFRPNRPSLEDRIAAAAD